MSNLNMPTMDGLEILQAVRSQPSTAQLPFFITSQADKDTILAAAKHHVSAYLLKPFSPDALQTKIEKVLMRFRWGILALANRVGRLPVWGRTL